MSIDEAATTTPAVLVRDEARQRRIRPWAIVGGFAVAFVTGGVTLSYTPVFGARVVEVEGTEHLTPLQVLRAAGVGEGTNVVHLDERSVESRLEMHPWIQHATVMTSLPATVVISVSERSGLVVADLGQGMRLIAADGADLGRAPWPSPLPEVATAEGAPASTEVLRAAARMVRAMPPDLRSQVDSVVVAADATAALVLDGGVDVRYGLLGETTAKAQALGAIIEYADREDRGLVSIDISAPAGATARFVGAPAPVSAPDPSGAVVPEQGATSEADTDESA